MGGPSMVSIMALNIGTTIFSNMGLGCTILFYLTWFPYKPLIIRLIGAGFPTPAKSTAATLAHHIRLHCIIFGPRSTANLNVTSLKCSRITSFHLERQRSIWLQKKGNEKRGSVTFVTNTQGVKGR